MTPRRPTDSLLSMAALLCLLSSCGGSSPGSEANTGTGAFEEPPNVILFVIDTLRADRLGCYGNPANPSPTLDQFAKEGILFERMWAPSPYTATSHASLFTSTYPATHGIWNRQRLDSKDGDIFPALPDSAITLAEVMSELGWETAAIAGGGYVNERRGLAQGFDYFDSHTFGAVNRVGRAIDWIKEDRDFSRPFFMFLHTYEVHYPYLPDEEMINRFDSEYQGPLRKAVSDARIFAEDYIAKFPEKSPIGPVQKQFFKPLFEREDFSDRDKEFVFALYDAEIAIVDREFKKLLQFLKMANLDENTVILVTADHGEELWEHGYFGHHRVWDEVMHIPFLAQIPGGPEGVRRSDSMDLVDVMPSLLKLLEAPIPQAAVGEAINWLQAPAQAVERVHIHQANWPKARDAVRTGETKVHFFPDEEFPPQVFNLAIDSNEANDLAPTNAGQKQIEQANQTLESFLQFSSQLRKTWNLFPVFHGLGSLTSEMKSELEGLGYLDNEED